MNKTLATAAAAVLAIREEKVNEVAETNDERQRLFHTRFNSSHFPSLSNSKSRCSSMGRGSRIADRDG